MKSHFYYCTLPIARLGREPPSCAWERGGWSGGGCGEAAGVAHSPLSQALVQMHRCARTPVALFYNDLYEVPLPPTHRFPMDKYREVPSASDTVISLICDRRDCRFADVA